MSAVIIVPAENEALHDNFKSEGNNNNNSESLNWKLWNLQRKLELQNEKEDSKNTI